MTESRAPRTLGRRLRSRALLTASWLACRLPEAPLLALADLAGGLSYRLATERRRRARRNLLRIARWLAAHDLGPEAARAAASDPRALSRLVRAAFRNQARYYVQLARAPIVDRSYLERRLVIENAAEVDAILAAKGGKLFVGMHLGWFELPALIAAYRSGRPAVVPSETLPDPDLQAYMVRTRRRLGLDLIELGGAKRRLREALERGETVGLLGDRDITGGGIETDFFGAPAPLAAGPALLALETGVTPHVFGVWRDASGVYHGRAEAIPFRTDGSRRERVTAWLEDAARAFERHIAIAPEQWLAVFHPIWPDLEGARARSPRRGNRAAAEPAAGATTKADDGDAPEPRGLERAGGMVL
jgi:phosphatidylinositol dimannoside acyltransferase